MVWIISAFVQTDQLNKAVRVWLGEIDPDTFVLPTGNLIDAASFYGFWTGLATCQMTKVTYLCPWKYLGTGLCSLSSLRIRTNCNWVEIHFLLPLSNHNKEDGERTFFFFQFSSTHTYLGSNKCNLSARRKTEIVIKDFVTYGLITETYSWMIYFFPFLP